MGITQKHSENVEVITVKDARYEQPHYLLLHTRQSISKFRVADECGDGKIELVATYLYGPSPQHIGHVVINFGGSTWDGVVKIANGDIRVEIHDLKSLGIGSFMLNRVIRWAKEFPAHYRLKGLNLTLDDARTPEERDRRNKLYRRFGIRLVFADPLSEAQGTSEPNFTVGELIQFPNAHWKNVGADQWFNGFKAISAESRNAKERMALLRTKCARFKLELRRVDSTIGVVRTVFWNLINWPLLLVTGFVCFGIGKGDLPNRVLALMSSVGL